MRANFPFIFFFFFISNFFSQKKFIEPPYLKTGDTLAIVAPAGILKNREETIEKAKKLLGYNPQFDLRKGLEQAISWYWENLG